MLEITEYSIADTHITKLAGRLDGVNSDEINKFILTLLDKGIRNVIFDFSDVSFLSSAGLRVLLINQKKITAAGGEIALYKINSSINEVFRMSGFLRIFRVIENDDEFIKAETKSESVSKSNIELENLSLEILKLNESFGNIETIGNIDKIEQSDYDENDAVKLFAKDVENAFGFAAIGDEWENVNEYFGESFVINNSLFVYPAVRRPAVDFMIYSEEMSNSQYTFLNGFKVTGKASQVISFKIKDSFIEISELLDTISKSLAIKDFAFTIIAESKGLRGMNLRQVPTKSNKPQNNKSIFDNGNFSDWVNFPVDQDDFNSVIAGVGFYAEKPKNH